MEFSLESEYEANSLGLEGWPEVGAACNVCISNEGKALPAETENKQSNESRYSELERRETIWMGNAPPADGIKGGGLGCNFSLAPGTSMRSFLRGASCHSLNGIHSI